MGIWAVTNLAVEKGIQLSYRLMGNVPSELFVHLWGKQFLREADPGTAAAQQQYVFVIYTLLIFGIYLTEHLYLLLEQHVCHHLIMSEIKGPSHVCPKELKLSILFIGS